MSCKYSSTALLLLLASCCLCLQSGTVASTGIYARINNVVFATRGWASNEPSGIQTRSGVGPPLAASAPAAQAADLQRPQVEQSTYNGERQTARQGAAAPRSDQAPTPAPVVLTGQGSVDREIAPAGPTRPPPQLNNRERFSSVLFQPIALSNQRRNVVYSPSSVHAMLALLYCVSSGQTADELRRAGQFVDDRNSVGKDFERLNAQLQQLDGAQLIVANKLFYNREHSSLNPDFRRYANQLYGTDIEAVDMRRAANTASKINAWGADATRQKIRELVSASDIDEQTHALLVNAIYFKARWATEFSSMDTNPEKFRVSNNAVVTVPMMYNDDIFPYADLPELNAKALELPYAGTQATMLLILPNEVEGLPQLERMLANPNNDLNVIASRLRRETVTVRLPKFRIEMEQDLMRPLQQLRVNRMFTVDSEIDAMLMKKVTVSKFLQKAYIDVNEAGSEAAAASYAKFVPLSLPLKSREFTADHPFIFAIRTPETVLFIGHVVLPTQPTGAQ
ncbi:antichymotrypsin-2 [Drosophila nasuta]|uniref:antichymotrypsin-2 n=1 Tax=Drosophila nasuta TaxID=42062 RepID=UPI00295E3F07|nr:antichymotrypsin-2 [Drosophila nasuta]